MPKQDISVRQLVDKVISGELTLPEMQRRYVWTAVKVRDLLDSLYRGYPSGAILVWETDQQVTNKNLQVDGIVRTSLESKLLLLDGQQRLTSLTAILSGNPVTVRNKRRPIDILFNLDHPESLFDETEILESDDDLEDDLEDEEYAEYDLQEELRKRTFVVASSSLKNNPVWISVTDIFKMSDSQLLKPLKINSDDPRWDKYSERIKKVKKIEDYSYVMQILDKKMSYEEVTEIFVRVNSLGVKLRGSDLALAQITSRWRGFLDELEGFADEFESNEEFFHDSGIMTKTLVAFATGQSKYKTVGRVPLEKFKEAWGKAQIGLRFAINFLKTNAKIENLYLLSSPFLLIPIACYSVTKGEKLTEEEQRKLLLWFYVAHMKGRFSRGSSESILDADLSVIFKGGSLDDMLYSLRLQFKDLFVSYDEIKRKNRRSPYFSLLFFMAKQHDVKDWFSGIGVSEKLVGHAHALQHHHIFPKSLLKEMGIDRRDINEIANLAFISGKTNRTISNKDPDTYLVGIADKYGEKALLDQFLPKDRALWKLDRFPEFLDYRRKRIADEINSFLQKFNVEN